MLGVRTDLECVSVANQRDDAPLARLVYVDPRRVHDMRRVRVGRGRLGGELRLGLEALDARGKRPGRRLVGRAGVNRDLGVGHRLMTEVEDAEAEPVLPLAEHLAGRRHHELVAGRDRGVDLLGGPPGRLRELGGARRRRGGTALVLVGAAAAGE